MIIADWLRQNKVKGSIVSRHLTVEPLRFYVLNEG
jgi:hypothetical protein